MSESKELKIGKELTDEELMEMTGGGTFYIACQKNYAYQPSVPTLKYGIMPAPEYGVPVVKYGIPPVSQPQPLYGIMPEPQPVYGIVPIE
ncbi:MAG: hypothetical protein ACOYWZ_20530 [Bacillota bacterium]